MVANSLVITGATGYIGSHLLEKLLSSGWNVSAIVRPDSSQEKVDQLKQIATVVPYDFHLPALVQTMRHIQPQVVIHLASHYIAKHTIDDVDRLIEGNIRFSTHVLQAASEAGVRKFINTSSFTQHRESEVFQPLSLYASTKQAFESIIEYYAQLQNMNVVTLELFDTYGPADTRPKFLNVLLKAYQDSEILSASPGNQRVDYVYIDDVVSAYLRAIELLMADQVQGHQKYAVSSGKMYSLRELVSILERMTGVRITVDWGAFPYRDHEIMQPWNTRNRVPGWNPKYSLEEGLRRILN